MNLKFAYLIDGNFMLNKTVFSLHKMNSLFYLPNALTINFKKYSSISGLEKLFFISDSRKISWRKDIFPDYKGKRHKAEDIDWQYCFDTYNIFKKTISEEELAIVLEEPKIEGDDWIGILVRKLNSMGISCIIISADQDYMQLLNYSTITNTINFLVNDISNVQLMYAPDGYLNFLTRYNNGTQEEDLFDLSTSTAFDIFSVIKTYDVREIEPEKELFKKLIQGDKKSDNIPSVWTEIKTIKNGDIREMGIGDKTSDKIWEDYINAGFSIDMKSAVPINPEVINFIIKHKKLDENDENIYSEIKKNLIRNIKLIYLHHKHIPENLKNIMVESIKANL